MGHRQESQAQAVDGREAGGLNAHHQRGLQATCQHIDQLLSDMEGVLADNAFRRAFPRYVSDVQPARRRVIEDYIVRMRAQLVRVLEGQGIERPRASIPSSRFLGTAITSVDIAVEELQPEHMRGYGEVGADAARELNGIVGELRGLAVRIRDFLAEDDGRSLSDRLGRLRHLGAPAETLATLEAIVARHGLAEFGPAIAMIAERLEDTTFEVATFGRVSSNKSSLLNAILGSDVLPVGVLDARIRPLYGSARELRIASLHTKVGVLRLSVAAALRAQVDRSSGDEDELVQHEARLRRATARLEEAGADLRRIIDDIGRSGRHLLREAAEAAASGVATADTSVGPGLVATALVGVVQRRSREAASFLDELATELGRVVAEVAAGLGSVQAPAEEEFRGLVRELPVFEFTHASEIRPRRLSALLGERFRRRTVVSRVEREIGTAFVQAVERYARLLQDWGDRVLDALRERFELDAEGHRAQIARALDGRQPTSDAAAELRRDLTTLIQEEE